MKLGADWIIDVLDAQDYEDGDHDFVSLDDVVPGDTIEIQDRPRFVVENISPIRQRTGKITVRRYRIETDEGDAFTTGRRKVKRF